ncbi:unnamed protein product [Rhizoctonia solani]|uniref:Laminin domain protein n=1 Tax=Rhizoctonia solani TaxID=456999 RepID=A0A8H2WF80_9AGAM|nr:unnamed protein product [Rhizoctonia solani]
MQPIGFRVVVPGMHDPTFLMSLADHLFSVQMARYQSRYSLTTFPSDATYTPPVLPTHISINLEPVSGAPSDDQLTKVQDAIQTYQELRRIPSMFDAHINMELSQHFFDLQMARHMRVAGESQSSPISQTITGPRDPAPTPKSTSETTEVPTIATNNAGTGGNASVTYLTTQPASEINVGDLIQRSNQLLERSNQLLEQGSQSMDQLNSLTLAERFNQVFERLAGLTQRFHQPVEQSDRITERSSQLIERFNQLLEQSNQPAHEANKLTERSNELANRANELAEKLNQSHEQSNQLAKQANKPFEKLEEVLSNINRVLVGIQHAIVRNHKGNTVNAINCLVNDKGDLPGIMDPVSRSTIKELLQAWDRDKPAYDFPITINGEAQNCCIPNYWLGDFLRFYGIFDELRQSKTSEDLKEGMELAARNRLSDYLSSCLG